MAGLKRTTLAVIRTAALVGGCVSLIAALLAQGGRVAPELDVLTHFAPLWLLGGLACALCGLACAKGAARSGLVAVGALAFAAAALPIAPEILRGRGAPAPAGAAERIRLIQFNAWELNREPAAAAEWIAGENPDLVTIEELTPPLRDALERRGYQVQTGVNGAIAIFSRTPRCTQLPVPTAYWPVLPEFARATFVAPDNQGTFTLVAVHLQWPTAPGAWRQTTSLADFLNLYDRDRLIVAGDFNLTPWSFALRRFDDRLGLERRDRALPTWPARISVAERLFATPPGLPIDHVYAGAAWRTVAVRRGPSMGSDHYPIVVDLALSPGTAVSPSRDD